MLSTPIPNDLCAIHREHFRDWRDNHYNARNPTEWPGGGFILDCRTSHQERERDWDRKNLQQMDLIARICRSGRSPQCQPAPALKTAAPST